MAHYNQDIEQKVVRRIHVLTVQEGPGIGDTVGDVLWALANAPKGARLIRVAALGNVWRLEFLEEVETP